MPNRDYAARSKSKKGGNKMPILLIIILLLLLSGLGLWILKESAPTKAIPTQTVQTPQPKSTLPTPPEEVYSYIRDLETREVPVDKNSKLAQLTKEQEQQLLKQKEEAQRLAQQAQEQTASMVEVASEVKTEPKPAQAQNNMPPQIKALTPEEFEAKKAREQKLAEEKRKQAELKKQQETAKNADVAKTLEPQKTTEAQKAKSMETVKTGGKYGLQCGAFKNKAQAENMQARLAMAGYNARINSNAEWNRVVVGPLGDRAAAVAAQSNARSVAECLVIGM